MAIYKRPWRNLDVCVLADCIVEPASETFAQPFDVLFLRTFHITYSQTLHRVLTLTGEEVVVLFLVVLELPEHSSMNHIFNITFVAHRSLDS